jgi:hypothetical protein
MWVSHHAIKIRLFRIIREVFEFLEPWNNLHVGAGFIPVRGGTRIDFRSGINPAPTILHEKQVEIQSRHFHGISRIKEESQK